MEYLIYIPALVLLVLYWIGDYTKFKLYKASTIEELDLKIKLKEADIKIEQDKKEFAATMNLISQRLAKARNAASNTN